MKYRDRDDLIFSPIAGLPHFTSICTANGKTLALFAIDTGQTDDDNIAHIETERVLCWGVGEWIEQGELFSAVFGLIGSMEGTGLLPAEGADNFLGYADSAEEVAKYHEIACEFVTARRLKAQSTKRSV